MAAPIFNSTPTPEYQARKALYKLSRPGLTHIVLSTDDQIWTHLASADLNRALLYRDGMSLKGATVFLIPGPKVKEETVTAVTKWYASKGANVRHGAPTRFERPELV